MELLTVITPPNNSMQPPALRAAAEAGRYAYILFPNRGKEMATPFSGKTFTFTQPDGTKFQVGVLFVGGYSDNEIRTGVLPVTGTPIGA